MIDMSPMADALKAAGYALLICVPLALWKLIDIVWWIFTHVRIEL